MEETKEKDMSLELTNLTYKELASLKRINKKFEKKKRKELIKLEKRKRKSEIKDIQNQCKGRPIFRHSRKSISK